MSYNVFDTVKKEVVRVEKIDPTIHAHHSNRPFTKEELAGFDTKKESK